MGRAIGNTYRLYGTSRKVFYLGNIFLAKS